MEPRGPQPRPTHTHLAVPCCALALSTAPCSTARLAAPAPPPDDTAHRTSASGRPEGSVDNVASKAGGREAAASSRLEPEVQGWVRSEGPARETRGA